MGTFADIQIKSIDLIKQFGPKNQTLLHAKHKFQELCMFILVSASCKLSNSSSSLPNNLLKE